MPFAKCLLESGTTWQSGVTAHYGHGGGTIGASWGMGLTSTNRARFRLVPRLTGSQCRQDCGTRWRSKPMARYGDGEATMIFTWGMGRLGAGPIRFRLVLRTTGSPYP